MKYRLPVLFILFAVFSCLMLSAEISVTWIAEPVVSINTENTDYIKTIPKKNLVGNTTVNSAALVGTLKVSGYANSDVFDLTNDSQSHVGYVMHESSCDSLFGGSCNCDTISYRLFYYYTQSESGEIVINKATGIRLQNAPGPAEIKLYAGFDKNLNDIAQGARYVVNETEQTVVTIGITHGQTTLPIVNSNLEGGTKFDITSFVKNDNNQNGAVVGDGGHTYTRPTITSEYCNLYGSEFDSNEITLTKDHADRDVHIRDFALYVDQGLNLNRTYDANLGVVVRFISKNGYRLVNSTDESEIPYELKSKDLYPIQGSLTKEESYSHRTYTGLKSNQYFVTGLYLNFNSANLSGKGGSYRDTITVDVTPIQ